MKNLPKRSKTLALSSIALITGIILMIISIVRKDWPFPARNCLFCTASSLCTIGFIYFITAIVYTNREYERHLVEKKDERHIRIREKANSVSYQILIIASAIIYGILYFLKIPINITNIYDIFTPFIIFVFSLQIILQFYYSKRM